MEDSYTTFNKHDLIVKYRTAALINWRIYIFLSVQGAFSKYSFA